LERSGQPPLCYSVSSLLLSRGGSNVS